MTNDFSQETLYGRTGAKAKPAVDIQFKYTAVIIFIQNQKKVQRIFLLITFKKKSIEEQVKTIEDSFEASKRLPVHPTKPGLTPVNITPFFPDHEHWRSRYFHYLILYIFFNQSTNIKKDILKLFSIKIQVM